MSSLRISQICHYCGGRATTSDHIVPRADLPRPLSRLPYWFRSQNEVPACFTCNGDKAAFRSDCLCAQCTWCWCTAQACFMPVGYQPRGYVSIVQNRPVDVVLIA
jgi:hypothetical protein